MALMRVFQRRLPGHGWALPGAHEPRAAALVPVASVPVSIDSQDDLARLQPAFRRTLGQELGALDLAARLCPVLFEDGSAGVFAAAGEAGGDAVAECLRLLCRKGYALAQGAVFVLPLPLLLAVARGQLDGDSLSTRRRVLADPRQSGLAAMFQQIIAWAVAHDASDIHVNVARWRPQSEVRYTVAGRYVVPEAYRALSSALLMDMLSVAWMDVRGGNGAVFDPAAEQQGAIRLEVDGQALMLRWASLATDDGPSVCLRLLRRREGDAVPGLAELGYLPGQVEMLERARLSQGGAVVLAGVVGSGKSTTLASLIRSLPAWRKVVTLEDPVEYVMPNALQNTLGRRLDGEDHGVFGVKLRTLKRSAMHDLMIGEIRDVETGRAFMDLAGSGMSLYTTVHAGGAALIGERLASDFIGISRDFLAAPGVLKLLVYQCLLPRLCAVCSQPMESLEAGAFAADGRWCAGDVWREWTARIATLYGLPARQMAQRMRVRNMAGCAACRRADLPELNGIAGRTVVAEMLEPGAEPGFLASLRQRDVETGWKGFRARRCSGFDEPCMQGKTAMECAVYQAWMGIVDPRDIEPAFASFATVARQGGCHE